MTTEIEETYVDEIVQIKEANDYVTPYQCAAIVNEWLEVHRVLDETTETGFKQVPPQMFYNYTNKGYITVTKLEGKNVVDVDDLRKWYVGYVTKARSPKKTKKHFVAPELPSVKVEVDEEN